MYSVLLLTAALVSGQVSSGDLDEPAAETPAPSSAPAAQPALERPSAANPSVPATSPDRWMLMKLLQGTSAGDLLDSSRIQISGWEDLGATFGTAPSNNLPLGFNYRDNNFSVEQSWVRIDRPVISSGTNDPSFGFRTDLYFGTDYRYTIARGLLSDQLTARDGQPRTYGFDPVQFYAEAYFPTIGQGLDIKVGKFYAQYGVESIEAPGNALFSHAYTYVDNPYTQTGAFATLQLTKEWSVLSGFALGEDVFFDGGKLNYLGNIKWTPPGGRDSVTLSVILDSGRDDPRRQLMNTNIVDLIVTHKFGDRLSYSFESLGGSEMNVPGIGTANWLGVVHYLTYDFSKQLSGTTRLEYWDDAQGIRTGSRGLYSVLTAGLNYHPYKDVIIRPELRYDYNDESRSFEGEHGLFTAAMDVILRW